MVSPSRHVVMAYHQNRSAGKSASLEADGWWRPEAWWRPEFSESDRARSAREILDSWLLDTPAALGHVGHLVNLYARPGGRATGRPPDLRSEEGIRAVTMVSAWLDEVLYGQGRAQFHREERHAIQTTADSMARADFCRMDFRVLVSDALECGADPVPINPPGRVEGRA